MIRFVIVLRPRDIWIPRPLRWIMAAMLALWGLLAVAFIGLLIVAAVMMLLGI